MMNFPVDKGVSSRPVDVQNAFRTITQPERVEEEAFLVSAITTTPLSEAQARLEAGGRTDVLEARRRVEEMNRTNLRGALDQDIRQAPDAETAAELLFNEESKQRTWQSTGDHLYLESVLSLQNPTINAELARFNTNVQIGEEAIQEALRSTQDETGVFGYIADFVDRYFLRSVVIGGFEEITNRSERGGREHLNAALNLEPEEYKRWIKGRINELEQEGIFRGDNFFALAEDYGRMQNAGFDPAENVWRILGAVEVLPLATLLTKTVGAATKIRRVRAIAGPQTADDVYETSLKVGPAPKPRDVNDGMPEVANVVASDTPGASLHRTARIRTENRILADIDHMNEVGAFGRGIDSEEVRRAGQALLDNLRKITNNPLVNITRPLVRDGTGGNVWHVQLGTVKTGKPYATEKSANKVVRKIQKEFPTARAVPVDETDPKKGYYIDIEQRLDIDPYVNELSWKSAMNGVKTTLARFMGSKGATEAQELNTLAVIAEGAESAIGGSRVAREIVRGLEKLPADSRTALSRVYNELRDGKDAGIRNSYSDSEFADKFRQHHPTGADPREADLEAFRGIQEISDAAYMMRAHGRLQKYVARDYFALVLPDGTRIPGRKFDGNTTELIMDLSDNTPRYKRDLRKNTTVWELDRELEGGIRYVAKPKEIRALDHSDVLGYNAGGRRVNPNANYFLVSNPNNPRAFLTAVTEEQASIAATQIGNIRRAVQEAGGLDNIRSGSVVDEVIRANNDWNTEIQNIDDLIAFQTNKEIDLLGSDTVFKARDGELRTGEVRDGFSQTWDDFVTFGMHRSDEALTEFGGAETRNMDAVSAILDDFGSITHQFAWNTYTNTALNSWLKSARRAGSGWDVGPETDPRRAFENAVLRETANPAARELGMQRNIINRRLGIKSEAFRAMESYGAAVQEYVFNKSAGRVELPRDPIAGASQALLNFGFQSAFGLGNISQFFVQGYHALTIAALTQNSVTSFGSGMKAVTMYPSLRLALFAPDSASEALAIRRLAKHQGQSEESIREILDYIRTSGRNIIDGSAMENGTGVQFGIRGWKGESHLPSVLRDAQRTTMNTARGGLRVGLTFFREGERAARMTGITTAVLEYQAKFPGKGLSTAHARKWISKREQDLSFRMTNANRAFMQEGFGKLPTQWFSYTLRSFENVIIGRDFTKGERARLAAALFPAFGLTGMGAASATDWLAEKIGAEPAGQMYTFIKYGVTDTLLEAAGLETAAAERLAPITLIPDVLSNIDGNKAAWEVALGPSGDILGGVLESVLSAAGNIYTDTPVALTEDTIRIARQWTGIDNVAKAVGIWNTGMYRSRSGRKLPFELSGADAIAQLFGFAPREVEEFYQERTWAYNKNTDVRNFTSEMTDLFDQAMDMIREGDSERGIQLLEEVQVKISLSGLSPIDQATVRRGLRVTTSRPLYDMIVERTKRGDHYAGERIEETFDFIGTTDE